ncbi:hypothetical protein [Actinocrispum sp. NPDC049592]|uniref:hypothetical protein n=1 Tax=Actinocrispum sp. NPDC049592 TaxID=3154835 RepID=UPI00341393F3
MKLAAVTVLAVAGALMVPAGVSSAQAPPVWVVPGVARPGQHVTVQVNCAAEGGSVRSAVLSAGRLAANPDGHQPWAVFATGTVKSTAKPGKYDVTTVCEGRTRTGTITVRQVAQKPKGAPQTGGGGTSP